MKLILSRHEDSNLQMLGSMVLFDDDSLFLSRVLTLELPYRNNKFSVSCIPVGEYVITPRWSVKYGNHFQVLNVPSRSMILIHAGNYFFQTRGCILVGSAMLDINGDKTPDVLNSKGTLKKLVQQIGNRNVRLIIQNSVSWTKTK